MVARVAVCAGCGVRAVVWGDGPVYCVACLARRGPRRPTPSSIARAWVGRLPCALRLAR